MTLTSCADVSEAAPGITGLDVLSPAAAWLPHRFSVLLAIKHSSTAY